MCFFFGTGLFLNQCCVIIHLWIIFGMLPSLSHVSFQPVQTLCLPRTQEFFISRLSRSTQQSSTIAGGSEKKKSILFFPSDSHTWRTPAQNTHTVSNNSQFPSRPSSSSFIKTVETVCVRTPVCVPDSSGEL